MGERRRHFILLGVLAGALALAILLGAAERGSADINETVVEGCASKPICVTITDQTQASISPSGSPHYTTESVVVAYDDESGATSKLVNLTVTMTWKDTDEEGNTIATGASVFEPTFSDQDDEDCELTAPQTLTCTTPKSLASGGFITYDPLVFRTATNVDASAFTLSVKAAAKEQQKPTKGGAPPNSAFVDVSNSVTYEGNVDQDVSIAGNQITTTLATSSTAGRQFSRLPVGAGGPRSLYTLSETDCGTTEVTCIGQQVTTVTNGQSPVNLQITYTGPLLPGTTEGNIVVVHTYGTTTDFIDSACSGAFYTQPPASELEGEGCRRASITRLPGGMATVELDIWALNNGDWRWG